MKLFTYGTLQFDAVIERVCGRVWPAERADLPGYACYCLRGRSYPGIVVEAGSSVSGVLYHGLTARDFRRLDRYEGDEYLRLELAVDTGAGRLSAWVYLPRQKSLLSNRPWRIEEFRVRHYRRWLAGNRNGL